MKVLELKGYNSIRALNVFHKLMLGLKMLPSYLSEDYLTFFDKVQTMSLEDQEKLIREAALFVDLLPDEIDSVLSFCTDANGVPYSSVNIKNLKPDELFEGIVAVCIEISKIKINLISESEKKKLNYSQSIHAAH